MKHILVCLGLVFFASTASSTSSCQGLYPNGNLILGVPGTVELCNGFYVSIFSPSNKAIRLVGEYLDPTKPVGTATRIDAFRQDTRAASSPKPSEYRNSGWDKGHMAPAQDASNVQEMYETFLSTNFLPQAKTCNEREWLYLEEKVRKLAKGNKTWVLNIPVYSNTQYLSNIPIPSGFWKIVYLPTGTKFFFAENKDACKVIETSPIDIQKVLDTAQF